ncbi:MAG: Smr/MutS family protein [Gluconacetobacter diazotrophicus]|nr:Smr/MutS family protein [Gluconacetobacter diazotrophicus]
MSGSGRLRPLSAEEIELWCLVAKTVAPRQGSLLPERPRSEPAVQPSVPALTAKAGKPKPKSVVPSYAPPQSRPSAAVAPLAPIERHYRKKVQRGLIGIERVMDLHGLTQSEAHGALRGFLRMAHAEDLRLVLVVTGKGERTKRADGDAGVLRRLVPHWLREYDLRGIVLGFEEASQGHGGAGALYIRLRRRA